MKQYHEPIYIEGGPWKNDCSGRADFGLLKKLLVLYMYQGEHKCEYERTLLTWKSPLTGEIHTIFRYIGIVYELHL